MSAEGRLMMACWAEAEATNRTCSSPGSFPGFTAGRQAAARPRTHFEGLLFVAKETGHAQAATGDSQTISGKGKLARMGEILHGYGLADRQAKEPLERFLNKQHKDVSSIPSAM